MNYIKKLKSLGFKRTSEYVIYESSLYEDNGKKLIINRHEVVYLNNCSTEQIASIMNTKNREKVDSFKHNKYFTFIKKIDNVEIYLMIFNSYFTLYVRDESIEDKVNKYSGYISVEENKFYCVKERHPLNNEIYNVIKNSLPINVKRNLMLRNLIK